MLRMATIVLVIVAGCLASASASVQAQDVTAAEARAIAKDAYVYGFPMVDNYRIQYAYFVDTRESRIQGAVESDLQRPARLLPQSLLVANPINRYLINSPMLPQLVKDADGGLTLYVQNESPGKEKEPNWLPAPKGPFVVFMRLYWPKEAALDGSWKAPPMTKAP